MILYVYNYNLVYTSPIVRSKPREPKKCSMILVTAQALPLGRDCFTPTSSELSLEGVVIESPDVESILQKNYRKMSKFKIKLIWLYLMQISKDMLQFRFCAATTSTRSGGTP